MDDLSIGLLLPSSSIMPMGKQYSKGFKKGLKEAMGDAADEVEIIPEMTGNGSFVNLDKAMDKLFGYHGVDAVAGLSSAFVLANITDRFKKEKVPVVCGNLGEHYQPIDEFNEYVFLNSEYFWHQCWLMGRYAAQNVGKKGTVITAMYDSGYAFSISFQLGMQSASPDIIPDFHLMSMPPDGALSNMDEVFEKVNFDEYDFALVLFCGEEAAQFLEGVKSRGLQDKLAIFGLPFLLEPGKEELDGMEVYTSMRNAYPNQEDFRHQEVFTQLGVSSGKAIGEAMVTDEGSLTLESINEVLERMDGQRVYKSEDLGQIIGPVSIIKNKFVKGNEIESERIAEVSSDLAEDAALAMARSGMASSWMNPYLGV